MTDPAQAAPDEPPPMAPKWAMTQWFGPLALAEHAWQTAKPIVRARLHLTMPDPNGPAPQGPTASYAAAPTGRPFIVDYVADLGDGLNPTLTIAAALGAPQLVVDGDTDVMDGRLVLPRGQVLVMGGDEVYPRPRATRYWDQAFGPYAAAVKVHAPAQPDPAAPPAGLFVLPGNHDWYDGLERFHETWCTQDLQVGAFAPGGWRTRQRHSYFAVELPHDWWLLGVDSRLDGRVPDEQLAYFRSLDLGGDAHPGARVILCWTTPAWLDAGSPAAAEVHRFVDTVIAAPSTEERRRRVPLYLSGDWHHYARYVAADATECRITAGGGGGFVHPTHLLPTEVATGDGNDSDQVLLLDGKPFPTTDVSRRAARSVLTQFLPRNPRFATVPALFGLALGTALHRNGLGERPALDALRSPGAAAVAAGVALVVLGFATTSRPRKPMVLAIVHAALHVAGITTVAALATRTGWSWPARTAVTAAVWAIAGSVLMGLYLGVACTWRRAHRNEAFAALRDESFKSFLRLEIDAAGALTVYPVGISQSADWQCRPDGYFAAVPGSPPRLLGKPLRLGTGSQARWRRVTPPQPEPAPPVNELHITDAEHRRFATIVARAGRRDDPGCGDPVRTWSSLTAESVAHTARMFLGEGRGTTQGPFRKLYSDEPAEVVLRQRDSLEFVLEEPFRFVPSVPYDATDPRTYPRTVQRGDVTDLASVPTFLTWLVPRYGRHTLPALLHDDLQTEVFEGRAPLGPARIGSDGADELFRDTMGESGVPLLRRWLMWTAVSVRSRLKPKDVFLRPLVIVAMLAWLGDVGAAAPVLVASLWWPSLRNPAVAVTVVALVSPMVMRWFWPRGLRVAAPIAAYSLLLVSIPVIGVLAISMLYLVAEWVGTLGPAKSQPIMLTDRARRAGRVRRQRREQAGRPVIDLRTPPSAMPTTIAPDAPRGPVDADAG